MPCYRQGHCYRQHADVTFSAVLHIKLMKVRPLCADRDLCQIETVRHDRSYRGHPALKISKCCASPTIPCDLVVVISHKAKRKCLREMLHERPLNVELGSGRVVRVGVFAVDGEAYGRG